MTDKAVSALTSLTGANTATGDLVYIVDISEAAAADRSKKITLGNLFVSVPAGAEATPSIAAQGDQNTGIWFPAADTIAISTNGTRKVTFSSGGSFLVGTVNDVIWNTTNEGVVLSSVAIQASRDGDVPMLLNRISSNGSILIFARQGLQVGDVSVTTTATAYNTSSDYRLKDNPQPLTNSGAFIDALKPKTWDWKADGSKGVGFLAHEVQEVSPGSVNGEKDAVDADGKPVMQAMEYGSAEFIANIVAELQSLRARVAALEAR